jgi:valyl-tRNA synthetase
MENIRDWCISRQLWWGHRIPVWYYTDENGEPDPEQGYVVSVDQPEAGMVQEEDVLDTWFSSWLWPFATLGWPEETDDLEAFYPTDVLVSGYDILFFWIARMIMAGYQFTDEPPFEHVFITGMVKDEQGRWMSKSLGNGIDPLEMVDQYGADATRFTLTILCAQGQDIKLAPSKFEMGRNFANKIWNAYNVFGQFMQTDDDGTPVRDHRRERSFEELELVEQWMLHRLNAAIEDMEDSLTRYRLNEMAQRVYDVFWRDYCDWYLELIKPPYGEEMSADRIALAVEIYETLLKLLHPFMPFITEELWWKVRPREAGEACIVADWPTADASEMDADVAETFDLIQELVSGVRGIKSDYGIGLGTEIDATVSVPAGREDLAATVREHAGYFEKLASVTGLTVEPEADKPSASASVVVGRCEVFVPLAGVIDLEQERDRLRKEIDQKEDFLQSVRQKLDNPEFVNKAPDEVVEKERRKKDDALAELDRLRENLEDLKQ